MKTLTGKLTLALAIILSTYIFASATIITLNGISEAKTTIINNSLSNYEKATSVVYDFEDEEYINDIPFGTDTSCVESEYQKAITVDFEFEEELYIDDIPFVTQKTVL